jgi:hypothetical protein
MPLSSRSRYLVKHRVFEINGLAHMISLDDALQSEENSPSPIPEVTFRDTRRGGAGRGFGIGADTARIQRSPGIGANGRRRGFVSETTEFLCRKPYGHG